MTLDDYWPPAETPQPVATPRKCRRHVWDRFGIVSAGDPEPQWTCSRCGKLRDDVAVRRGRSALRAGKDAERAIAKRYGGRRTGHFGGPDDVLVGELFVVQSKAGGWFSERVWAELAKLPRTGGRVPTLVVSDRPGRGNRTRRYVVRMLEDDLALHGDRT